MSTFDIVTVYHSEKAFHDTVEMFATLQNHEPEGWRSLPWDNRLDNLGFGPACNRAAKTGRSPIITFLNPDLQIKGPFLARVEEAFTNPEVKVTGCRFGKPQHELQTWGVRNWVCGAAMFVRRDWFEHLGGFDEQFVWGWEETDFIRRTEQAGAQVLAIDLPLEHSSPEDNTPADAAYKNRHFDRGAQLYRQKWG